jgi:hypothetical protein
MILATARRWVRRSARSAGDSSVYTDEDVDMALQFVGQDFCRVTQALTSVFQASLNPDDGQIDIDDTTYNLMPEHLRSVFLSDQQEPLNVIDYASLNKLRVLNPDNGVPTDCAFLDNLTSAVSGNPTLYLYPINDLLRTLFAQFWVPFTTWLPGSQGAWSAVASYRVGDIVSISSVLYQCLTDHVNQQPPSVTYWKVVTTTLTVATDPATLTLNIPEPWLIKILPLGPRAILQSPDPEYAYSTPSWQAYMAARDELRQAGILGETFIDRQKA